jgi:hypothetical protein
LNQIGAAFSAEFTIAEMIQDDAQIGVADDTG